MDPENNPFLTSKSKIRRTRTMEPTRDNDAHVVPRICAKHGKGFAGDVGLAASPLRPPHDDGTESLDISLAAVSRRDGSSIGSTAARNEVMATKHRDDHQCGRTGRFKTRLITATGQQMVLLAHQTASTVLVTACHVAHEGTTSALNTSHPSTCA